MSDRNYSEEYFARYEEKGQLSGRERGRRLQQFNYWMRYASRRYPKNAHLLEIGCGMGYLSEVASEYFSYVGTDITLIPLQAARSRDGSIDYVQGDALRLAFRSEVFDVVVAFDILEHTERPENAVAEAHRILKKDGCIIATVPNTRSFGNRIKRTNRDLVPSMYRDPTHVSLLPPEKWTELFRNSGFTIIRSITDTLWDLPYSKKIPLLLQKALLIPFNLSVSELLGGLPWTLGENLVFVCRK